MTERTEGALMLGRTANGLYWMNRYIERAENMARLLDAGLRMALTRSGKRRGGMELGAAQRRRRRGVPSASPELAGGDRIRFPAARSDQPVERQCRAIEAARNNARMVRTALTRETWESINEAWMALKRMLGTAVDERDLPSVLDAIKRETALIRGAFYGTMLRNEIFDFSQLGTFVERADNTARILDVKYYVLLPSISWVGSTLDN